MKSYYIFETSESSLTPTEANSDPLIGSRDHSCIIWFSFRYFSLNFNRTIQVKESQINPCKYPVNSFIFTVLSCAFQFDYFIKLWHICIHNNFFTNFGFYRYEYRWADGITIKQPIEVSAPKYVEYLMDWIEAQLDDESIFPQKLGMWNYFTLLTLCSWLRHHSY